MTATKRRFHGPHHGYAHCEECGVDAHETCMDQHNTPATEVCDGRRLLDGDRDVVYPPVSYVDGVAHAPCMKCGAMTRFKGHDEEHGRTWCQQPECRKARVERTRADERRFITPIPEVAICICGARFKPKRVDHRRCSDRCRNRAAAAAQHTPRT